jgi:hypothetical protein
MAGLLDGDHFQLHTPLVAADEQQPIIEVSHAWHDDRLTSVEQSLDRSGPLPMRCLRADVVNRTSRTPVLCQTQIVAASQVGVH